MYVVLVETISGETGIVYDYSGRDPYLTHNLKAAVQKKKDCEVGYCNHPEKPIYEVYQLVRVAA